MDGLFNLKPIFNPRFTTKERGMGMGLSICHSIIENRNSRIWVPPGVNRGTIFQFEMPAKPDKHGRLRATSTSEMGQERRFGHVLRPSGLPSLAGVLLRCREPPVGAMSALMHRSEKKRLSASFSPASDCSPAPLSAPASL